MTHSNLAGRVNAASIHMDDLMRRTAGRDWHDWHELLNSNFLETQHAATS